jgi:hypothetical protein
MRRRLTLLFAILTVCGPLFADETTIRFEKYRFSVQRPDGWHVADAQVTRMFTAATHQGVIAHARQMAPKIAVSSLDSQVLLLVTKYPLGAKQDNPNITVSVEKSWSPDADNTGAKYLKLLSERFQVLHAPSKLAGSPEKLQFGGTTFFSQDAVNDRLPNAKTKQQYLITYLDGYYVTLVISYNEKADADYRAMRGMAESFKALVKDVQQIAEGDVADRAP